MTTDTLRQVFGTLRTPNGSAFPNKSLKWFRERRATVAQGSSVVLDDPFIVTTDAQGDIDTVVMAGTYLVMAPLSDADRYFRVVVPDQTGPFDISSLIDGPTVEPDDLTQFEALVAKAKAWANAPEDSVVESGEFSAKHYAAKAEEERLGAQSAVDLAVAAALAKAEEWAENPENAEVAPGQFSALHHAAKSQQSAQASAGSAAEASSARDSAFVNANVYPDIAAGRAAVADGAQFAVVSGVEIIRYRRDSSTTQTEVARFPAANGVAAIAARDVGYLVPPATSSALYRIERVEIFQSLDGVAITLPSQFCVREIGRDATSGGRFRMRFASFDGSSTYTQVLREGGAGHNGTFLPVVSGYTGRLWIDLVTLTSDLGVPTGRVVGRALVNFGAGEVFGTYAGTIAFSAGGLSKIGLQTGSQFANDVRALVGEKASLTDTSRIPFAATVINDNLHRVVRECWIMDAEQGERYTLSSVAIENAGGGNHRLTIAVRAIDRGHVVAEMRKVSSGGTVADFVATIPSVLQFSDFLPNVAGEKTGIRCQITLDLTGIDAWFQYGSTDYDVAGIHPSRVLTMNQQNDYLHNERVDRIVEVGSGREFATIDAAITALASFYTGMSTVNKRPIADEASYVKRLRLYLTDPAEYSFTLDWPDYLEVDGVPGAVMRNDAPIRSGAWQFLGSGKGANVEVATAATGKYAAHMDSTDAPMNDNGQFQKLRKSVRNMVFRLPPNGDVDVLGGGVSSGEEWLIEGLTIRGGLTEGSRAGIAIHNYGVITNTPFSRASKLPAYVRIRGGQIPHQIGLKLYAVAAGPTNICHLTDADGFRSVLFDCATADADAPDLAADRYTWRMTGYYDGPVTFADPRGVWVLETTPGVAVSGDAAPLIFGTIDDLGRGAKWVKDATSKSLGARLGDCSAVSKTLTIGAQSVSFTTDLTAATNAAVLAIINAAITSNPCQVIDIVGEAIAEATPQMPVIAPAATLPKGRFVTRSAAGAWSLAQPGDRIDGWTWRTILSGGRGTLGVTRRIARGAITGAGTSTGAFGISSEGQLDFSAATKVGRVFADGVIELW